MTAEQLMIYQQSKQYLIDRARDVAQYASSYRNFKVGCAILAWRPEGQGMTGHYKVFAAANVKPLADGPKQCAETTAVCYARSNGYTTIIAIVVAGEPQADDKSGIRSATLHPCWRCRTLLRALPEVEDETIVLTVHNHNVTVEEYTMAQILQLHGDAE
jgi:cytidine deaminase